MTRPNSAHRTERRLPVPPVRGVPASPMMRSRGVFVRSVGTFVPKLTQKAFEKYGFSAATLLTDWATIVGTDLASYTQPERLKWPRGVEAYGDVAEGASGRPGAILVLRVDGPRSIEVEHRKRQILERINAYFGYRAVADMRIIQAPITTAARPAAAAQRPAQAFEAKPSGAASAPPALDTIADEKLRAALARLGAAVSTGR